jgi:teichuronic acid exporter
MPTLKQKAVSGILWSSIERFSAQGIQFIIGILLARQLLPSDYGLIGMLVIFLAIIQTIVDSGFGTALIQKKNRDNLDYSTVFYFTASFCYCIIFIAAPYIAKFYGQPLLIPLTRIIGITIIINALAVVQRTIFAVRIDFKTQTFAALSSSIISGVIGVIMAYKGFGVWALAAQSIIKSGIETILLWRISKWVPKYGFSFDRFKRFFFFGSKILIANVLDTVYRNIYLAVIGKFFSVNTLGYYTAAQQLQEVPSANLTGIIQRATFPVLSQVQDDEIRLRNGFRKTIKLSSFVIFPLMMGLAALSEPIVRIVFTAKWIESAWMLKLLCFAGMWYPIHALNMNILNVKGRSDLFLKVEIVKKSVISVILVASIFWGIKGMLIGQIASSFLALFINGYYSRQLTGYGISKQLRDLLPLMLINFGMFAVIYYSTSFVSSDMYKIVLGFGTGILFYGTLTRLFGADEVSDLLDTLKRNYSGNGW